MIFHHEELALARAYTAGSNFEELTDSQMLRIMDRGRALYKWDRAHPRAHNLINLAAVLFIFAADYFVLMRLPALLLNPVGVLLASAVAGSLHSYLMYSLGVYSLHEGAAHRIVFLGEGRLARMAKFVAANLCRIAASDPDVYAPRHMAHHAKFGTEDDAEFLNFVGPKRYFATFFPLAAFVNFSDFIVHRPMTFTRGRLVSALLSTLYNGTYAWFMVQAYGGAFVAITMLVFLPHVGFYLDRLRQFTEHNLMPLDNRNGSRSFGMGFWGLLVGGGPWGSPCHWEHHLVASIPWYQQLILHRYVVSLLTPRQREQFLIRPVIGFPLLWLRLVRELLAFSRRPSAGSAAAR